MNSTIPERFVNPTHYSAAPRRTHFAVRPSVVRVAARLGVIALLGPLLMAAAVPWVAPPDVATTRNAVVSSPESIRRGRTIYDDRCADCHGRKGRGDGPGGTDLDVRPTDLTSVTVGGQSDGALFWKVTEGRRPMPAYGRKLSAEERWHLVNYIRSIAAKPKAKSAAR